MNNGKIEQFSTPQALYDEPATEFVANFIGSLNKYDGDFQGGKLVSGSNVVGIRPEDVLFSSTSIPNGQPATIEQVVPRGHFYEVYIKRDDMRIRSFISTDVPKAGDSGFASVAKALIYKDGKLLRIE